MMQEKETQLIKLAMEGGAFGAAFLPVSEVVLDVQFRKICESNRCGRYGRCYQCPPDIGPVEQLMEKLRSYTGMVLYQSVAAIEDSFDFEGMMEAAEKHMRLSQRIHRALPEGCLHLSSGCRLCRRCAKLDDLPCRHPETALGAVEGYGMDVYGTVKKTKLSYINGKNTVTYFGAIFFSE